MDKFHENIKRIRVRHGYSQDDMADLMGVERSTYSNFETGKTRLFCRCMSLFASALNMTEEDVIMDGGPLTSGYIQTGNLEDKINLLDDKVEKLADAISKMSQQLEFANKSLRKSNK